MKNGPKPRVRPVDYHLECYIEERFLQKEESQYGTPKYNGGLLGLQKREYLAKIRYHQSGKLGAGMILR